MNHKTVMRTPVGWKPVGQVQKQARRQVGLGNTEQEAQGIELPGGFDKGKQGGDDAPGNHDAGYPDPRTDLVQDDVAGYFAEEVADPSISPSSAAFEKSPRPSVNH